MKSKISRVHNSTPFALMFGLRLNGFNDYEDSAFLLLDEDQFGSE
jgi:hypothetical protein